MEVEKEFDITIPDDAAAKLEKVGDAVKYIDEHKKN
jgi:acyl carrier protein